MRKHYKQMGEKDFRLIKTLLTADLPVTKIVDITGRSWGVIGIVKKSNSLDEYKQNSRRNTAKYYPAKASNQPTEKVDIKSMGAILVEMNNNLTEIKTLLEKLVDTQVRNSGVTTYTRKGWFPIR